MFEVKPQLSRNIKGIKQVGVRFGKSIVMLKQKH